MPSSEATDDLFRQAVSALDAGDVTGLEQLLVEHPALVSDRLVTPGEWLRATLGGALEGFFKAPYLLWFVAEDPVRNGQLPANIADIARAIVEAAKQQGVANLSEQLDYALTLVSWSSIAPQCKVQISLIDVLVDAGASLDGNPENALVNGNVDAAEHLVSRGAPLTLASALVLERWTDVRRLAPTSTPPERQFALVLSALKGKVAALRAILNIGVDVNAVSPDLYSHATALHHAVHSGSLEAVKVLVEAGSDLRARDTAYQGTPLGWAEYSAKTPQYDEIAAYLRGKGAPR